MQITVSPIRNFACKELSPRVESLQNELLNEQTCDLSRWGMEPRARATAKTTENTATSTHTAPTTLAHWHCHPRPHALYANTQLSLSVSPAYMYGVYTHIYTTIYTQWWSIYYMLVGVRSIKYMQHPRYITIRNV